MDPAECTLHVERPGWSNCVPAIVAELGEISIDRGHFFALSRR
jgi:hypothetical protein